MSVTSPYNPAAGGRNGAGRRRPSGRRLRRRATACRGPPRRRRPGFAALAVLLVVGAAAAAGLLAVRLDARQPVLVARHDIAVGQQIDSGRPRVGARRRRPASPHRRRPVRLVSAGTRRRRCPAGACSDAAMLATRPAAPPRWRWASR
jgi:hypothetical protein